MAELHLKDMGLRTEWWDVALEAEEQDEDTTWSGVRSKYWNVASPYRLPIVSPLAT